MSVYIITGKLGSGKTLVCVGRIHDYLARGCRVATNLDIHMEHMAEKQDSMAFVERLPDYPTAESLEALGTGNASYDEEKMVCWCSTNVALGSTLVPMPIRGDSRCSTGCSMLGNSAGMFF